MTKTLNSGPIRVDWTETALWPGHLGLTRTVPSEDGRDLETDLTDLRRLHFVLALVVMPEGTATDSATRERYDAQGELLGLDVLHGVLPDLNSAEFGDFVDEVTNRLLDSETVAICVPEAGTLAACLLVQAGMSPQQGLELVRAARPGVVETPEQEKFVKAFGE
ncbi:protein-tyrosine-phosphatase [Deinococcus altitudinis]|uniref:protein-tyrosine-phosphatase n=1 Tax=Deinococcus altitudinis TaxID=468914 RepID=UPI00389213DC